MKTQYGSKKTTMINLSNKVYDKIDINQNKYFSYCRKEKKVFLIMKINEKLIFVSKVT